MDDDLKIKYDKASGYFDVLFKKAFKSRPIDVLYTVLRVKGLTDANWDPFEEFIKTIEDYNWLIYKAAKRSEYCTTRLNLLMYCQAVEMSAVHDVIMNLLRNSNGEHYVVDPFLKLRRNTKNTSSYIPPSAKSKFKHIKDFAKSIGDVTLIELIDDFFDDAIRNAFSHSDYILDKGKFRWTEGGVPQQIEGEIIANIITSCFGFYAAFVDNYRKWHKVLCNTNRYHKNDNYIVFEVIKNETGVCGFNVHFSNDNKATYKKTDQGTIAINLFQDTDGSIIFLPGFGPMERCWKIDGKVVNDWDLLENESWG